jgi:hypothetical protein
MDPAALQPAVESLSLLPVLRPFCRAYYSSDEIRERQYSLPSQTKVNHLASFGPVRNLVIFSMFIQSGWCTTPLIAQELPSKTGKTPAGHQDLSPPDNDRPQQQSQKKSNPPENKSKRGEIVMAPLPISSPALGTGIVPVLGYIFPLTKSDSISPPSVIGGVGLVTDNGSQAFAVYGDFYFKQNTYRATTVYANGNLNYNLYGIGIAAGTADLKIPLKQKGQVLFVEGLRRLGWDFFLGIRFVSGNSTVTVRSGTDEIPPPPDIGLQTGLTSLGAHLQRDTRPNRFYPRAGMLLNFTADVFAESLGSKYSFQSYRFSFSKYWSITDKQIIAYNLGVCGTGGKPPFYGNCIYGTNNQLRGYTAGRYLDRYMVSTQVEYRLELPWRFGVVAFGGIGEVVPGADQLLQGKNLLPAGGGGIRFQLSKKYHVNIRGDAAAGKNSHTWALGVGEAF